MDISWHVCVCVCVILQAGADRASVNEYHRLIGCALEQCQAGDAAAIQQLQPVAQAACIEFIRSNVLFQVSGPWSALCAQLRTQALQHVHVHSEDAAYRVWAHSLHALIRKLTAEYHPNACMCVFASRCTG